jgi:hypothetical protein
MKIRTMLGLLAFAALVVPSIAFAAEPAAAKPSAIQGEVLDLACYMGHGAQGEGHAGCAAKCLKGGQPMGLLGTDGTVYVLLASHEDASAFEKTKTLAGKKVEVTGEVATKGALKGITVSGVKAL